MSTSFTGQIMYTGFNFAPVHWAQCSGQLMAISQNTALFSLIGTFYGGNGVTTFALPDMRSRVPINQGAGLGLSPYVVGEEGGTENASLTTSTIPTHTHQLVASTSKATSKTPASDSMLGRAVATTQLPFVYIPSGQATTFNNMAATVIGAGGGSSVPFEIIQPILTVNCNICLAGVFPQRQ